MEGEWEHHIYTSLDAVEKSLLEVDEWHTA
jgi:hypothetical protein